MYITLNRLYGDLDKKLKLRFYAFCTIENFSLKKKKMFKTGIMTSSILLLKYFFSVKGRIERNKFKCNYLRN